MAPCASLIAGYTASPLLLSPLPRSLLPSPPLALLAPPRVRPCFRTLTAHFGYSSSARRPHVLTIVRRAHVHSQRLYRRAAGLNPQAHAGRGRYTVPARTCCTQLSRSATGPSGAQGDRLVRACCGKHSRISHRMPSPWPSLRPDTVMATVSPCCVRCVNICVIHVYI